MSSAPPAAAPAAPPAKPAPAPATAKTAARRVNRSGYGGRKSHGGGGARIGEHRFETFGVTPRWDPLRLPARHPSQYEHRTFAGIVAAHASFKARRELEKKHDERAVKLARRKAARVPVLTKFDDSSSDDEEVAGVDEADRLLSARERRRRALLKHPRASVRASIWAPHPKSDSGIHYNDEERAWGEEDRAALERVAATFIDAACEPVDAPVPADAPPVLAAATVVPAEPIRLTGGQRELAKAAVIRATPFPMFARAEPVATWALSALPAYDRLVARRNAEHRARREAEVEEEAMDVDSDASSDSESASSSSEEEDSDSDADSDSSDASSSSSDAESEAEDDDLPAHIHCHRPPKDKLIHVAASGKVCAGLEWLPHALRAR
ncbi:hypothetical protein H9P43_005100 [Blastocladiella emersonii ATCC 22665]|nr:hypothetical protein H9P43_005100 [Blastocladiella emersonii ATCC 22665]